MLTRNAAVPGRRDSISDASLVLVKNTYLQGQVDKDFPGGESFIKSAGGTALAFLTSPSYIASDYSEKHCQTQIYIEIPKHNSLRVCVISLAKVFFLQFCPSVQVSSKQPS